MTTKTRKPSALSSPTRGKVSAEAGTPQEPAPIAVPTGGEEQAEGPAADGGQQKAAEGGALGGHLVVRAATLPVRALGAVAGDISSAARRPDAVLYWGGLAGLAALGVLDWPVAAAIGAGVAVAYGVRRTRV